MKRSLRDYLLTLCLAVVIFIIVAFFLIRAAEGLMGDVIHKTRGVESAQTSQTEQAVTQEADPASAVPSDSSAPTAQKDVCATFLLLGIDNSKQNADAIFLVGINATKKVANVALIPSNTVVPENSNKYKLGELYGSRSVNFYKEFIAQETGITPQYYAAMSMSALANLIDFLGGISYAVPQDMYYFDSVENFRINLKAGMQTLNGDQAVQLVAYRGYAGGNSAREDTQIGFAKAFCATFLRAENLSRAKSMLYNIYYNLKTDFEESDLDTLGEVIFNFPQYSSSFTRVPGAKSGDHYAINSQRARALFEPYA